MWRMHYYYSHFAKRKWGWERLGNLYRVKEFLGSTAGLEPRSIWLRNPSSTTRSHCLCKGRYFFSPTVLSVILSNSTNAAAWLDNLISDKPGCINIFFWYSRVNSPEQKRNWWWGRWRTSKLGVCDNQVTFTPLLVPISQCQPSGPSENMCGFRT